MIRKDVGASQTEYVSGLGLYYLRELCVVADLASKRPSAEERFTGAVIRAWDPTSFGWFHNQA